MTSLLEVEGLKITHGVGLIVDGVDLTVASGETVGLVGESGSGKSLTARAVAGLLPRGVTATGSVSLDGIQLMGARERILRRIRGRRIGLLMQDPFAMLNPLQTAGTHITESLPPGTGHRREEVTTRLAEVGIDDPDVARRYPFQLSGGMRQRVAIASALARDPELLIADEPTTALDATIQHEIMQLLARTQQARGMAVLLITHDLRVAFALCDRVAVMYAGRIVEQGPRKLAVSPAHPYTAGLIGALPSAERTGTLITIPGNVPAAGTVRDRCAFADRCGQAEDDCVTERPPLREIEPDRLTACRYPVLPPPERSEVALAPGAAPPPTEGRLLAVRGLGKDYGQTTVLRDVDLDIARGERVGLVGESGSGKTTLARCLLGLVVPGGGRIELDGMDVTDRRRLSRTDLRRMRGFVQCVFQDPSTSLNPARTVGATLAEAAGQGPSEDQPTVNELLELVGLPTSYAKLWPGGLSGGEKQRVAIARALAVRPALLICDEPVASLDVSVQAHVLELLRSINRDLGTSLLFITHDLAVVRQITDRLVVLLRGDVVETGRTGEVLDAPAHDYTGRLVASVPPAPAS